MTATIGTGCSESDGRETAVPPTFGTSATGWTTLLSGEADGNSWQVQFRATDTEVCGRVLPDPAIGPADEYTGGCISPGRLSSDGIVELGGGTLDGSPLALAGGLVVPDATTVVLHTVEGEAIEAEVAKGAWYAVAPPMAQVESVVISTPRGEQQCPWIPDGLVLGTPVSGP